MKVAVVRTLNGSVVWALEPFAAKENIKIEPIVSANYTEVQRHVQQGTADIGLVGYQNVAILADQGATGIKMTAGVSRAGQNLVVRKGSGITDWADLKGKKIGVIPGSYAQVLFLIAAQQHGINPSSIDLVNVTGSGTTEINAMKEGQLDGYVVWAPVIENAIIAGVSQMSKIDMNNSDVKDGNSVLISAVKFMNNTRVNERFMKAFAATMNHLQKNQGEWAKMATLLTGANPTAVEMAVKTLKLNVKPVRASLVGAAKYGMQFGYTKTDSTSKVESFVDMTMLGKVLGVNPKTLWD